MLEKSRLQNLSRLPAQRMGGTSSFLGGLLSLPPPSRQAVAPMTNKSATNDANGSLILDRKLKHVRDVLKLAASAVLPLYRGALHHTSPSSAESKDDDDTMLEESDSEVTAKKEYAATGGRTPSTVYDYEAAVQPSTM